MKKLFSVIVFIYSALTLAQSTGSATLNIQLKPVLSISVNNPTVGVELSTVSDYLTGKSVVLPNHITTFATNKYEVTTSTTATTINSSSGNMDLNTVTISADSSFPQMDYSTPVELSTSPKVLFTSSVGGGQKNHNVTYKVHGDLWDKPFETYTVNIIYTITAN